MAIDVKTFKNQFDVFKDRILRKSKQPFTTFREGLAEGWEGYKLPLRQEALRRLGAVSWQQSSIGSGQILKCLISAIEIPKKGPEEDGNNLVRWRDEYGHRNRSHYTLLDALDEPGDRRRVEQWAFEFFRGVPNYEDAFEALRSITGSRYDLLAYLFFLRDDRFMPIGVKTFDKAFEALGLNVHTVGKASWENYQEYIGTLQEIRAALTNIAGLTDVRLVDAHSFCWLLVRPELERDDVRYISSSKGKASNAKKFGGEEIAIIDMRDMTLETVRNANGQTVTTTRKVKELWMSPVALEEHLRHLMAKQERRCALTGLVFHFRNGKEYRQMLPSLDRIDSAGHYAVGNVQIVCRFVNRWKGAMPDEEFRDLLERVRRPADAD